MSSLLDSTEVRRWVRLGADALGRASAEIDALNVFPVADGDTGTNLHLTMLSAAEAVESLPVEVETAIVWQTLAYGALVGARGNSGVIVSQALRGLAEVLKEPANGASGLREGLVRAAELARGAVARPVEGTVLSVLDAVARAVREEEGEPATVAARAARAALGQTPEQLGVLADNGVVDAGGAGLVIILDALEAVVTGTADGRFTVPAPTAEVRRQAEEAAGYEVMYLLDADDVDRLRAELDVLGDSLVIVGGDGLWNVHVHAADAGAAIEAGLRAGRPHRIRVTYLAERAGRAGGGRGVVAVTAAAGLATLFEESGAVVVRREPGATPPLAAMVAGIREAGGEVAVLPNDEAVRAVATAAAEVAREDGVTVSVLPTKATVQGLAALAVHDPLRRFDDDVVAMTDAAGHTRYGHLTVATSAAFTSAGVCRPGDVLGLIEGDVVEIGSDLGEVAIRVVNRMLAGGGELVTLVTGAGLPERLPGELGERLGPLVEVTVHEGGQDGYPLFIGVE